MTTEMMAMDEFDVLLNDVLRTMANPELPERVKVQVRTRVWVKEMNKPTSHRRDAGHPVSSTAVFAPEVFLAQMSPKRNVRTTVGAVLLHVAAIGLLFWAVSLKTGMMPGKMAQLKEIAAPPIMPPAKLAMDGGGGQRGPTPVVKGQLPKFAEDQITPPKAPPLEQPKIQMPDPTIQVQPDLKMANNNMANLGMPNSPMIGMGSMGNGHGAGMGSGFGAGLGAGSGGNYGGGVEKIGGGVSSPVLIRQVEPEFSEEARKAKFMGDVLVSLVVDPQGMPRNVRVLHGVGMGLDEKAMEAVRQYRFHPAMEGGKPVAVQMNVEVEFQIF